MDTNLNLKRKKMGSTGVGGTHYKQTLWGRGANMGGKISLLVYQWPHAKCKIWYMNESIFQLYKNFEPKLAQI